ncbi:ATP-dependent zinc metalloprotease FtsH [Patescibacteria group bacterium]|nr:ATP-dependent zinc metalloprotease FtsH [Patescibacteria group bacterium]MBU1703027.1 ATP-dependent zinc metalloprotease FtsH [Patescibacteria group bacterium]
MKKPQGRSNFVYLLIIALIASGIFMIMNPGESNLKKVNLDQFISQVKSGEVAAIAIQDDRIDFTRIDDTKQYTFKEPGSTLDDLLKDVPSDIRKDVSIEVVPTDGQKFWTDLIFTLLPFIFIAAFLIFMMRQAQNSTNQAMSFGKSRARMADKDKPQTTFKDVAGALEAKEELIEVVDFLKNPAKYTSMGAKIPKGVILVGAPGTGKTLLARAVAGEAAVPFFNISGSEFVEMFVGVGASRVRDLFKKAKRNAPCIVFIDEIDAVGRQRGAGLGGGNDEREQTLNQILTEMDGFETGTNIIVMAATNRPDVLDPALLRPGRFDRRVVVDVPDINDREAILKVHSRGKTLAKNCDLRRIAAHTPGFTGADLENLMNEAAIRAAKGDKKNISMEDLEQSIEKVMLGPERKSRVLSKQEKKITAYHEVGHAVVGHVLPQCEPVHKISIVSRGMALGVTWFLPEEDKHLYPKSKFLDEMCSLLGGYVAEEIFFGEQTTGASNDLEKATNIARRMVTEYGMSDLGPVIYGDRNQEVFLGRDFGHVRNYSEQVAASIDKEIRKFLEDAYTKTKKIVIEHKKTIERIADKLIQKETLNRTEFRRLFDEEEPKSKAKTAKKAV